MKKIFLWIVVLSVMTGCKASKDGPNNLVFMQSFITSYVDGTLNLNSYGADRETVGIPKNCLLFCIMDVKEVISTPSYGSTGEEAARFLEIAKRNGDVSYDRNEPANVFNNTCCADNFKSIQVKCSNAAWDGAHPAGSLLNDIVSIQHTSFADYVHKGYPDNYDWNAGMIKPVNDLTNEDLAMISPNMKFYFSIIPAKGSYEMVVTLTKTDGEEKTAKCTFVMD